MSEHTPLTEAERIERLLEDHTLSVRTEFGDVAWTGDCTATGCRWTEWGPIGGRAAADRAHRRHVADLLAARTSTATADTGLRERVEAVFLRHDERTQHSGGSEWDDGYWQAGQDVKTALDATPASTEDRADNEGTP